MRRWWIGVPIVFWAATAGAGEWDECQKWQQGAPVVAACTKVIGAGRANKASLSQAYAFRGVAHAFNQDSAAALTDLDKAISLDAANSFAFYNRGVVKRNLADFDGAFVDFDRTVALNPQHSWAYRHRGIIYYQRQEYDRALADYDKSIELGYTGANAFHTRGLAYEAMGQRDRAVAEYRRALTAPDEPDIAQSGRKVAAEALTRLGVPAEGVQSPTGKVESAQRPAPVQAVQGPRVALIIGNSAYQHTSALLNPYNDASALAATLRRLGFQVIEGLDVDVEKMAGRVRDFSRALKNASIALFFYAGHGLQLNAVNYLVPVDAKLVDEADAASETIELNDVLKHMERQAKTNIVILDACRNNPLARNLTRTMGTRSAGIGQGLAEVRSGVGTMIAFATQPGNVALDGVSRHSPFTAALLKHIETPGLDIGDVLRRVRRDVLDETKGRQIPWDHSSLTGPLVLVSSR